jgi:adenylate kinase
MIEHHLTHDLTRPGFLLDGFPRNLSQAQALNELLDRVGQPLDVVLFFEVDYGEIMQRLLARKRADDTEDTIRKRLEVYEEQTAPLINYYKERGNLRIIDGIGDIDEISQRIARVLDEVT